MRVVDVVVVADGATTRRLLCFVVGSGGGGEYFNLVRGVLLKYSVMSRVITSDSRRDS